MVMRQVAIPSMHYDAPGCQCCEHRMKRCLMMMEQVAILSIGTGQEGGGAFINCTASQLCLLKSTPTGPQQNLSTLEYERDHLVSLHL